MSLKGTGLETFTGKHFRSCRRHPRIVVPPPEVLTNCLRAVSGAVALVQGGVPDPAVNATVGFGPDGFSGFDVNESANLVQDFDLALTGVPASITTAATGSGGAVVSYTSPTATDEGGETPAVGGLPASGSMFAVGTTTVTCTATDADDSNSPVTATFSVTVTDADLALHNVPANITTDGTGRRGRSLPTRRRTRPIRVGRRRR